MGKVIWPKTRDEYLFTLDGINHVISGLNIVISDPIFAGNSYELMMSLANAKGIRRRLEDELLLLHNTNHMRPGIFIPQ